MVNPAACQELDAKVIRTGLCTLCGACVGNCPYFAAYEGRVLLKDVCDLPEELGAIFQKEKLDLNLRAFRAGLAYEFGS